MAAQKPLVLSSGSQRQLASGDYLDAPANSLRDTRDSSFKQWWFGTQAQYGAIGTPDSSTLYVITDAAPGGTGTVTSVGLSLPAIFTISGSPVTSSGTLTATLASQTANLVWASPDGSAGAPTFRALVAADIPTLAQSKITNLTTDLAAKAPLASPTFTGTPVLPDAATIGAGGPKVGYRNVPVNLSNAALTLSADYDGEAVYKNNTTAYTYSIPDGLADGTVFTFANCGSAGNLTIAMSGSEVLRLAGTTMTGSRTVAPYGEATVHRVGGMWLCAGPGVT